MSELRFTLLVEPKSVQHGSRVRVVRGKPHYYNDSEKVAYQDHVILESKHHRPREPMVGPLAVMYRFMLPKPKKPTHNFPSGFDLDNGIKGTQDALTKAGFWVDDQHIVFVTALKVYAEEGTPPRIEISIKKMP